MDAQLQAQLDQIKGLIVHTLNAVNSQSSSLVDAKMDFFVDIFDRQDQDDIGPYWLRGSLFSIRNGKCYPHNSTILNVASYGAYSTSGETIIQGYGEFNSITQPVYAGSSVTIGLTNEVDTPQKPGYDSPYTQGLSSTDITVEMVFNVVQGAITSTSTGTVTVTAFAAPTTFGAAVYTGPSTSYGVEMIAASLPSVSVPSVVNGAAASPAFTVPSETVLHGDIMQHSALYKNLANVSAAMDFSGINYITNGGVPPFLQVSVASSTPIGDVLGLVVTGPNVLLFSCTGLTYTVTLNGTVIYSATASAIATTTRLWAGIQTAALDLVSTYSQTGYECGIISIRAWNNNVAPPPLLQSGHGRYSSSGITWYDKYHVKAANGSVSYNPNA